MALWIPLAIMAGAQIGQGLLSASRERKAKAEARANARAAISVSREAYLSSLASLQNSGAWDIAEGTNKPWSEKDLANVQNLTIDDLAKQSGAQRKGAMADLANRGMSTRSVAADKIDIDLSRDRANLQDERIKQLLAAYENDLVQNRLSGLSIIDKGLKNSSPLVAQAMQARAAMPV